MTVPDWVKLVTIEEFEKFIALPENTDRRFELINGEIVEKMPTERHSLVCGNAYAPLREFVKARNLGRIAFGVRYRAQGDEHNSRVPDVSFTRSERLLPIVEKGAVPQLPDLAIEVKSPDDSLSQMREKAAYFLANGVSFVWLIHPQKKFVEVYWKDGFIDILNAEDTLDGYDVLPGFTLPVSALFED